MSRFKSFSTPASLHVLLATWLGMLFDGMDASIYILTLHPCLSELLKTTSSSVIGQKGALIIAIFMCGWAIGAIVFGLLADRIGRAKTLVVTVLLYTFATGFCASSQSWEQLALYRFLVGCGIGGEISIGGVMLAECWKGKSRLHATGILQTAFSCGFLLLAAINLVIGHLGWRYLYVVGAVPALLAIYIRMKLKEPATAASVQEMQANLRRQPRANLSKEQSDLLKFPLWELFGPRYRRKTLVVVMLASTVCMGNYAVVSWIPAWVNQLTGTSAVQERSFAIFAQNLGAILAAASGGIFVMRLGRAWSFRIAFTGSIIACIAMFLTTTAFGPTMLAWCFTVGFFVMAPYTYLFIYVPELFETRLRATAFGFSIQLGRVFAALAAVLGGQLITMLGGSYALAGACVSVLFVIGIAASFFLPPTNGTISDELETSETDPVASG